MDTSLQDLKLETPMKRKTQFADESALFDLFAVILTLGISTMLLFGV